MGKTETLPLPSMQQHKEKGEDEASGKEQKVEEDEEQDGRAVKVARMDTESGLKTGNEETTSGRILAAIGSCSAVAIFISILTNMPLALWRGKYPETLPWWYHFIFVCIGLSSFCIGESNLISLLHSSRWESDRRRRAPEEQKDYIVSRDMNLWNYLAYNVSNSFEIIYRASIHEEPVRRNRAILGAWASFFISCLAIYGHAGGFRDVYSYTINRYTKSRQALWWMLLIISGASVTFNKFVGPRV